MMWQTLKDEQHHDQKTSAAKYRGAARGSIVVDGVNAYVAAEWARNRSRVILTGGSYYDPDTQFLRIDAAGKSAQSIREEGNQYPKPPEIAVPFHAPKSDVTVRTTVGGDSWKPHSPGTSREVRLSPSGAAFDAKTGKKLPNHLWHPTPGPGDRNPQ